jgi:hypothetical protein
LRLPKIPKEVEGLQTSLRQLIVDTSTK